jgi:diguanylate cyclase
LNNSAFCRWLVGADRKQRIRLLQCGVAMLLSVFSVLNMAYLVWAGYAPLWPVVAWASTLLGGFVGFFLLIRSGRNQRFADPSLTVPQMVYALLCGAVAYALAGQGRGGAFPILMVVFMFGMYSLSSHQVWRVGLLAVGLFGVTMVLMSHWQPEVFVPRVEVSHFIMIAIMVPAIAVLTGQLAQMRERMRRQKKDIAAALARIQDLATRDELTGLINRRHMVELMEQERQRGVRSGQTFCIALINLDDFAPLVARHGADFGDLLLQAFAREALGAIRLSDLLARWHGAQFLLMLSDTRSSLARMSLERMRERIARLQVDINSAPVMAQFSVGVVEHHAGESVAETIARAEQALHSAQAIGCSRLVMA